MSIRSSIFFAAWLLVSGCASGSAPSHNAATHDGTIDREAALAAAVASLQETSDDSACVVRVATFSQAEIEPGMVKSHWMDAWYHPAEYWRCHDEQRALRALERSARAQERAADAATLRSLTPPAQTYEGPPPPFPTGGSITDGYLGGLYAGTRIMRLGR